MFFMFFILKSMFFTSMLYQQWSRPAAAGADKVPDFTVPSSYWVTVKIPIPTSQFAKYRALYRTAWAYIVQDVCRDAYRHSATRKLQLTMFTITKAEIWACVRLSVSSLGEFGVYENVNLMGPWSLTYWTMSNMIVRYRSWICALATYIWCKYEPNFATFRRATSRCISRLPSVYSE